MLAVCETFETFVAAFLGTVRGLEIKVVKTPPTIDNEAKAVCGTKVPKTTVAPIKGAPRRHKRAQQIVENEHILRFSTETNSMVQVVKMAKVLEIAIFEIMAVNINKATR